MPPLRANGQRRGWVRGFALGLFGLVAGLGAAETARGADDFLGAGFEQFTGIPAQEAAPIEDAELDELRGTYLGFFFSVTFSGLVELDGSVDASLSVLAGFGDQSGDLTFESEGGSTVGGEALGPAVTVTDNTSGEAVKVQAVVGGFGDSQGIFQISQIPGNDNSVQQSLLINLAVIQAPSADAEAVRDAVAGFFLAGP